MSIIGCYKVLANVLLFLPLAIGVFGAGGKFVLYCKGAMVRQGMSRDEAVAALEPFGEKAETLRRLVEALLNRTK